LPPATAKNVISVGAAEVARPNDEQWVCIAGEAYVDYRNIGYNSKRGTRAPNWYKPDLFAPAAGVWGLLAPQMAPGYNTCGFDSFDDPYVKASGTSFAAPVAAGAAVLAARVFAESRRVTAPDPTVATPALIKAMLVASAVSMRGGLDEAQHRGVHPVIGPLPNAKQGFGRIALAGLLDTRTARTMINDEITLASAPSLWSQDFQVHDPAKGVKIVLVWTDAAGEPAGSPTVSPLVNDLNLSVAIGPADGAPCRATFVGNETIVLDEQFGEENVAHTDCTLTNIDVSNNVEVVLLPPHLGTSRIRVTITRSSGSGTQSCSLVAINAFQDGAAPPVAPKIDATMLSTTSARIAFNAVVGASRYYVLRKAAGVKREQIGEVVQAAGIVEYVDGTVVPNHAYLYQVEAQNSVGRSAPSAPALATATTWTDSGPLDGVAIKAAHVVELQTAVNEVRVLADLPPFSFTGPVISGATIRAVHIDELRSTLLEALEALGVSHVYSEPSLQVGVTSMKAAHVMELRELVR
jgi:hypothetical protein